MSIRPIPALAIISLALVLVPAYQKLEAHLRNSSPEDSPKPEVVHEESHHEELQHKESHKILVTSPVSKLVTITQQYVCQIHSHRHIEVCALQSGYLEEIPVREGQEVRQGETMFTILPTLYQARLAAEAAEVKLAQIEFNNTEKLFQQNVVAQPQVALAQAKLSKAQAKLQLTQAELDFTTIKAPFDGIIDHQHLQQGSLIAEGDVLTTLSDNKVMWVYFNVPETRYLEYVTDPHKEELVVELRLANGKKFSQVGKIGAIEADFNNETGNIAFRADFPNPDGLLRHGQTGTVLLSRTVDAVVIPQRATFEILAKRYAYVISDEDHGNASEDHADASALPAEIDHHEPHGVVRQREIIIQSEQDDIYLLKDGLNVDDKIILEGIRQVRDGDRVEYEFRAPGEVLSNLKYHAE
jgi:membrane fusion protein (multidrug efflux system)